MDFPTEVLSVIINCTVTAVLQTGRFLILLRNRKLCSSEFRLGKRKS